MKHIKSVNIYHLKPQQQQQQQHNQNRYNNNNNNDRRNFNQRQQQKQQDLSQYSITKPKEIATFSYDDDNNRFPSIINEFKEPKQLPINLVEGFDLKSMPLNNNPSPLDPILDTLESNNINLRDIDFITYRNNLNKIFGSYINKDSWTIDIETKNDIIHLGIVMDAKIGYSDENHAKSIYSGFKFEELATSRETTLKYCSIVKTRLANQFNIILAAEIDCIEKEKKENQEKEKEKDNLKRNRDEEEQEKERVERKYIELKTYRLLNNDKTINTFERFKTFAFWMQSFWAGIETIVCGFRDEEFNVTEIKHYNTHQLSIIGRNHWNPNECMFVGYQILQFIKSNVLMNQRYSLQFIHPNIVLYQLDKSTAPSILPSGYQDWLAQSTKKK
ncbi:hypothetical protein DFA_08213 [Cavenderia fasciculata]|uniref:Decapping nuclease n=1 Tax=Cavenderia fasciculata TaxID=261658 RepID=F4Q5G4_CACFS|nr:uncharacterized protein DFA_08213 [Cavenderia fasciculata]EGG17223.1 hypothetical protein DFA_08213 [Cavenderia fasciculata]|eukprot:XP_004355707.1 hypothetical protein DFA_08213 [Cavenderia fasciculata]